MKFLPAAVLCFTFVVAFGSLRIDGAENHTVAQEPTYLTEEEAVKHCNPLFPVTEDPRQKMIKIVINAETINQPSHFSNTEWCHLNCLLEKVGYYAPDGSMRVHKIVKFVLGIHPEFAPKAPTLLLALRQIDRSTKAMPDKCARAYISYYRFVEAIAMCTLSADLHANAPLQQKVVDAVLSGNELPKEIDASVQKSFQTVELFFKKIVEDSVNHTISAAPVLAP